MAANDTLKIAVQVVEDEKKSVESLVKKVQLMLDKDFKLKVSDDAAVKKLEDMLSVLKSVETQMGVISKGLSNSSWGKLGEDLNIAIADFRKLTASAEEFGRTMSKGFASNLKAELDALLPKLSETSKLINKVKDESRSGDGSGGILESAASIAKATRYFEEFYKLATKLRDAEERMGEKGFNTDALSRYKQQLIEIYNELDKIRRSQDGMHPDTGLNASEYLKSVGYSDVFKSAKDGLKSFEDAEAVMAQMAKLADEIQSKLNSMSERNPMRERLEDVKRDLENWQGLIARNPNDIAKDTDYRNQKMREYQNLLDAAVQKEREMQKAIADSAKEEERMKKSVNDAFKESDALAKKILELEKLISSSKKLKIDTLDAEGALSILNRLKAQVDEIIAEGGKSRRWASFNEYVSNSETQKQMNYANDSISKQTTLVSENERAKRDAAKAADKLSAEEKKLADAMKQTNQHGFLQTNVLNDLKSMATQYLSIWGAKSFVENMAQITGELELQQKSLEVIIGSASYASQLFGEIRDLSQQSPYTFQDLLKSTRQLAAFGIETKDLYGTMKSLSNIGAGLSVDVQRLILAYGHTKSYGYLSGIQNRQFETAGIDLVGALADRYNKLADAEERAGRAAEHVTRKDVFKMISKKEVGFEDVNAVIMGLDAPGGRFYNMQERQFETLGGKLRNLRNNYNIMMAEMGKANHGMLMSGVNMLNELTEHWDKYARLIGAIVIPIGALRLANMALNTSIGLQTSAMSKNVMAMVRSEKAMAAMNAAAVKRGIFSPFAAIGMGWSSQGKFTPGRADAKSFEKVLGRGLDSGSLTKTNLMYMGLSGDLPERYRRIALALAGVRGEQVKTMASAKGLSRMWLRLKITASSLGASLRGLFAATLANPLTWIMAAVSGITYLVERTRSLNAAVGDAREKYGQQANEDVKNIDEIMGRYDNFYTTENTAPVKGNNGQQAIRRIINVDEAKLEGQNVKNILDELKQELQAHSPLYDAEVFDIEGIRTEAGRVQQILRNLESHRYAKQVYSMIPEQIASANRESGGWFNDTFAENAKDYQEAMRELTREISKISETEYNAIIPEQKAQIEEYIRELGMTRNDAIRKFVLEGNKLQKGSQANGTWSYVLGTEQQDNVQRQWKKVIKDSKQMVSEYANVFKDYFQNDPVAAEDFFITSLRDLLNDNKVSDPETQRHISEYIMTQVRGALGNMDVSDAFKKAMDDMVLMANVKSAYQQSMENSNLSWASSRAEVDATSKKAWEDAFKLMIESANTPETKEAYKQLGEEHMAEYAKGTEQFWRKWHPDEAWKNRFLFSTDANGNQTTTEFAKYFQRAVNEADEYYNFWFDTMKKKYDEYTKDLNNIFKPLQKKWNIEIDADFEFKMENLEKLRKIRDAILDKKSNTPWNKEEQEELDTVLNRLNPLIAMMDVMKAEGIDFDSEKKNKGRGSGHGTYKDRESEVWEQRIKLIQEARREYDYWEKQIGKDAAQEKVKNQFENLVGADKVLKPGDLDNLERYADVLREINDEISARYQRDQKLPAGQKKDVNISNDIKNLRELDNALYNIGKGEFERGAEDLLAGLTFRLEELSRQWEIFNAVRSSSGDAALASRLTGISPGATPADLKRFAISQFAGRQIDFDSVLGMNDEQIEDYVHGLGVSEEKIKSIVNGLKEWSKAQKDQTSSDIQNYAKWLGSLVDLESIRMRNADEYSNTLKEIDRLEKAGEISGSEAARRRSGAASALETKNWQATSMYYNLYNNAHAMSRAEFGTAYNAELSSLKDQFDNGVITLQQYTEKVAQLNSVAREFGESGFLGVKGGVGAFLGGGVQGLASYYQQRSNKARSESKKSGDEADMEADMWQKRADSLLKMQHAAEQVVAVFNELAGVSDTLAGMFDALGMEGASNAMSDAGGILSGIAGGASSMAALGPYGMMAGAAIGAATSFAQLNDKRAERRIQKLSNEIGRISNTLDLIRSMREKELGYSRGRNIRALYSQYAGQSRSAEIAALMRSGNYATAMILLNADKASNAMREYYGNAIGDGSDSQYAMEYNLLLDQRKKKMQQYNEEAGKKKQDEGKLDEYKKEIAELDAQIQDFAENLMNELWGIDFKGWASQISDALMTAFENGTSLAKAFDETVTDILRNMSREMLNLAVVEPFMEKIRQSALQWAEKNQDMLFNNPQEAGTELGNLLGNEFRAIQEPLITAYQQAAQGLNDTLGQSGGWDLRNKGKSSGSGSNSVSKTITEDTAGFMTGILAAMHQDGSVRRLQLQTLVGEQVPNIIEMMTVSGDHIAGIDENTRAIMRMMQDGSGRMYERIDYIGTKLDRFANGFDRVTLR